MTDAEIQSLLTRLERAWKDVNELCAQLAEVGVQTVTLRDGRMSVPRQERPRADEPRGVIAVPDPDIAEIDDLLTQFQRACETVVVRGDSRLSETTKQRAILRNELRTRLVDGAARRSSE